MLLLVGFGLIFGLPMPPRSSWILFCGECNDDLLLGLRYLALDRAVYWFRPLSEQREIQVLAVFLGDRIISVGYWCTFCKTAPRA